MSIPCENIHEKNAWSSDITIAGIDEAGRGPLCGPVVVAGVILPKNTAPEFLVDSKKTTKKQRANAFEWITKNCIYTFATISPEQIDRVNIYQATMQGMRQTYHQLAQLCKLAGTKPIEHLVIDAMPLKIEQQNLVITPIIRGETASSSIAAASIVAKVIRDHMMDNYQTIFPYFSFAKHKGYGTAQHQKELKEYGQSIIHRKSFILKKDK
jgi:ribonuclease HII